MKRRIIKYKTNYLLPKNNFFVGLGSVININGNYFEYNYSDSENEADMKALMSDWENVKSDIREAKEEFEQKQKICLK